MRLNALQRDFSDWLRSEDESAAARLGVSAEGLAVYQNNYRGSLMACLEDSYPHTRAWLGEEAFAAAAADHITRVPPHSWTLDDYAQGLPGSLAETFVYDPEVGELAALEWALAQSFIAGDAAALGVEDLGAVNWERAVLRLVPSVRLLDMATNAPAIWSALAADDAPPPEEMSPAIRPLLVWRQEFTCVFRETTEDEREVLPRVAQGLSFAALCEDLVARHGAEDGVARAGGLLGQWARDGLLVRP